MSPPQFYSPLPSPGSSLDVAMCSARWTPPLPPCDTSDLRSTLVNSALGDPRDCPPPPPPLPPPLPLGEACPLRPPVVVGDRHVVPSPGRPMEDTEDVNDGESGVDATDSGDAAGAGDMPLRTDDSSPDATLSPASNTGSRRLEAYPLTRVCCSAARGRSNRDADDDDDACAAAVDGVGLSNGRSMCWGGHDRDALVYAADAWCRGSSNGDCEYGVSR